MLKNEILILINLLYNKFFTLFLAPFMLGAMTILSFPPYNLTFLNFFSFSLLIFLIFIVKKKTHTTYRKKKSNRYFFYMGCAFGFGFFLFGNYWISISLTHNDDFIGLIPFAVILIPLFLSLFFGLALLITGPYSEKKIYFVLFFSIIFSLFEFIRGNILTGFPWNLISYTWSWSINTIQVLSLIGSYSLSLISITLFSIPFLFLQKKIYKENIIFVLIFFLTFTLNYFHGIYKNNKTDYKFDETVNIKIVSPSFSLKDYSVQSESSQLERLIKISDPEKDKKTLFIWPEGIFYESDLQEIKQYQSLFKERFSENHLIILGINNFVKSDNSDQKKYFNSLVLLNYKLDILSIYNKINLVPFGEFLPLEKFLSTYGLKKITYGYNSFSAGDVRKIIKLSDKFNNKSILPLICYEIIYPGSIKTKNQFPDLLINISEDAWFGQSIGPKQHFSKSIYRSIEEGVFIARSANKGISAFIDPNGRVIKSLNTRETGNIELNFPYFYHHTPFSNYGNKIFFLIILLYIFLTLILKKFKI